MTHALDALADLRIAAFRRDEDAISGALEVLTGFDPAYAALGASIVATDLGEPADALAVLAAVEYALEPECAPWVTYVRYRALLALDQPAEALGICDARLRVAPTDLDALVGRAWALTELGEEAEAEVILSAVAGARPDHFEAQYGLARLLQRCDRSDEALDALGAAQRANPYHAGPYLEMARLLQRRGTPAQGAAFLEAVVENPVLARAELLWALADLYRDAGADDSLRSHLELLEGISGGEPRLLVRLGRLFGSLGDVASVRRIASDLGKRTDRRAQQAGRELDALALGLEHGPS